MKAIKQAIEYANQWKRVHSYLVWTSKADEYIYNFAYGETDTSKANWFEQWEKDNNITSNVEALVWYEEKSCSGVTSLVDTHDIKQFITAVDNECDREMCYCTVEEYEAARKKFGFKD